MVGGSARESGSGVKSIARRGDVAYGKFFDKKAGFISREWLPYFLNFRRDGYDFDALWEDGKASYKQKTDHGSVCGGAAGSGSTIPTS